MIIIQNFQLDHDILKLFFVSILIAISETGTVYWSKGKAQFKSGVLDKTSGAAYGTYKDMLTTTGWAVMDIKAGHGVQFSDDVTMYAAGFLEGALSARYEA